jgi:hypothetical protein
MNFLATKLNLQLMRKIVLKAKEELCWEIEKQKLYAFIKEIK